MFDLDNLISLFTRYGYEKREMIAGKYAVFSSGTSMYPAVEIVNLCDTDNQDINELKANYSSAGYAVRICQEKSIDDIERYLFNWFFQVKESNHRILEKYSLYTESIMKAYKTDSSHYKYINTPYTVENNFEIQPSTDETLLQRIRQNLNSSGAQLIIIEAGAGFGKTSTAYEILKDYSGVDRDVRPFFMELFHDRIAPTFHYLLNSQIDANFKVRLGSDLVLYNIRRGFIPLIIDGFDELLSRDLDNGKLDAKFEKVETMLSTIADLLCNQAKVILTTRKTAIFAGENFYNWYFQHSNNGSEFSVVRYQLEKPSTRDWLPQSRVKLLPENFERISNPVILGYLRYLNDDEFFQSIISSSLTSNYISAILKREMDRQDLPFNEQEQKKILGRLATCFAGYNSTSFSRNEIKETIKDTSIDIIKQYATPKKDVKSLANTLTNHAFLDRKGDDNIGFLNDFILGVFFMYSILNETDPFYDDFFKSASYSIIEKAIIAGSAFDYRLKVSFWEKIYEKCPIDDDDLLKFWCDTLLIDKTDHSFNDISLDGKTLSGVSIGNVNSKITNCSFANMEFVDCIFDFEFIERCSFINCTFNQCIKEGSSTNSGFYGCHEKGCQIIDSNHDSMSDSSEEPDNGISIIDILKLYFQVDERKQRMRMISCIKDQFNDSDFKKIFSSAVKKGFIITNGDKSFITKDGRAYYNSHKK